MSIIDNEKVALSLAKALGAVISKYELPKEETTTLFGNTLSKTMSDLTGKDYPSFDEFTEKKGEAEEKKHAEKIAVALDELQDGLEQIVDNLDKYPEKRVFKAGISAARGNQDSIDRVLLIMSVYKTCKEMDVDPRKFFKKYFRAHNDYMQKM